MCYVEEDADYINSHVRRFWLTWHTFQILRSDYYSFKVPKHIIPL